jgi:transcriptional regulator
MSTRREDSERLALLQGTLDLLILKTLLFGREHGQGIARAIQAMSGEEILIDHGSLYPALQRLEARGFVSAEWGISGNNRKARFYKLTASGKKQITVERKQWERVATAIGRVLSAVNPAG